MKTKLYRKWISYICHHHINTSSVMAPYGFKPLRVPWPADSKMFDKHMLRTLGNHTLSWPYDIALAYWKHSTLAEEFRRQYATSKTKSYNKPETALKRAIKSGY